MANPCFKTPRSAHNSEIGYKKRFLKQNIMRNEPNIADTLEDNNIPLREEREFSRHPVY